MNKNKKETWILVIEVLTAISLIVGIWSYWDHKITTNQNERITLENTIIEIQLNLNMIQEISEIQNELGGRTLKWTDRFDYYFTEKSTEFISSTKTRTKIILTIKNMKRMNDNLNLIMEYPKNEKEITPDTIENLLERNLIIKENLESIQKELIN